LPQKTKLKYIFFIFNKLKINFEFFYRWHAVGYVVNVTMQQMLREIQFYRKEFSVNF
jgi:hypothetical protein